jgi:hypothetical protein
MSAAVKDSPQKNGPSVVASKASVSDRTLSNSLFQRGSPDQPNKNAALDDGLDFFGNTFLNWLTLSSTSPTDEGYRLPPYTDHSLLVPNPLTLPVCSLLAI